MFAFDTEKKIVPVWKRHGVGEPWTEPNAPDSDAICSGCGRKYDISPAGAQAFGDDAVAIDERYECAVEGRSIRCLDPQTKISRSDLGSGEPGKSANEGKEKERDAQPSSHAITYVFHSVGALTDTAVLKLRYHVPEAGQPLFFST